MNDLVRRVQRGDETALAELVQLLGERVFRLGFRIIGDAGQAEEATADVFAKIWSHARQWRGESAANTWIYQLAYRTIVDHRRRRRPAKWEAPADVPDSRPGPLAAAERAEMDRLTGQKIRAALQQLPESDRAVVHLHYFAGLDLAEIAAIVGTSRDALKMRLLRARAKLRELLGDEEQ